MPSNEEIMKKLPLWAQLRIAHDFADDANKEKLKILAKEIIDKHIEIKEPERSESDKKIEISTEAMPSPIYRSAEFFKNLHEDIRPNYSGTTDLRTFLKTTGKLSIEDMRLLVEQALILLEMFYVHMPLKLAMHAIDPVQLRLLKFRFVQLREGQTINGSVAKIILPPF
jgi:hypothetical protein